MRIRSSSPVLAVHDLHRSAAWYAGVFDAQIDEVDPGNRVFCRCGPVTFMPGRCPDVVPASRIGDHSCVAYLHVEDVDAFHERAPALGAEVIVPPSDRPWGRRELGLRSPDGHRFMLGQPC